MGCRGEKAEAAEPETVEELARLIEGLVEEVSREADEARRFLKLLAAVNTWLESRCLGRLVVVGGFAVELYTGRVYRTMDVDVVAEGAAARVLEEALKRVAKRLGRGYLIGLAGLDVKSIDIVSSVYRGSAPPVTVEVGSWRIYVEAPEELVVRYLAGWKYWGSTEDRDKAFWVYAAWRDRMNHELLRRRAREEGVEDRLEELERMYAVLEERLAEGLL